MSSASDACAHHLRAQGSSPSSGGTNMQDRRAPRGPPPRPTRRPCGSAQPSPSPSGAADISRSGRTIHCRVATDSSAARAAAARRRPREHDGGRGIRSGPSAPADRPPRRRASNASSSTSCPAGARSSRLAYRSNAQRSPMRAGRPSASRSATRLASAVELDMLRLLERRPAKQTVGSGSTQQPRPRRDASHRGVDARAQRRAIDLGRGLRLEQRRLRPPRHRRGAGWRRRRRRPPP